MWEPVGPLPASVYWRRRGVAAASTVAAIVLLLWSVTALTGPTPTRATRAAVTAPQQVSPSPTVPSAPSSEPRAPEPTRPGTEGPGPPAAPATTSEELRPDDTPRPSVPAAVPVPVPPTGPVPCTDEMLSVTAEVDAPEHRVGQRPVLRLVVTNISGQPCVRDLDSARQEIVVWSEDLAVRLWSSNDCVNAASVDLRTLVPGQPVASVVAWKGRTTEPGCPQRRSTVPAGSYNVMTRVDAVISAPTPFVRLP